MGSQTIAPVSPPGVRRVFDALRWIVRELRLAQNPGGQGAGPSSAQLFVLHVLKERGPLSLGELAEATSTDPSSVSVVVRKLQQQGLVTKTANPGDRRRVKVVLTAPGARKAKAAPMPAQRELQARLERMAPEDLERLAGLLEQVAPPILDGRPAPMFFHDGAAGGRR
jgi:DNA-binding MarR family transcriptional regulator